MSTVQSSFTLLIIGGAFSAAGGLVAGLNWLHTGSLRRPVTQTHWGHHIAERDRVLKSIYKLDDKF